MIDAESFIKSSGFTKKTESGNYIYYTALKRVSDVEIQPYMESVKSMPQTETSRTVCQGQAKGAAKQLVAENRNDIRVSDSVGYGGPTSGTIACIVFYEYKEKYPGKIGGAQVYFLKHVPRGSLSDIYTVILTH